MGIDYYPRHALVGAGGWTLYMDGGGSALRTGLAGRAQRLMISEGQAEPWETVTVAPSPPGRGMYSCLPEHVIENYNRCLGSARQAGLGLDAYLFWGAEYWIQRRLGGDGRYLQAFARIVENPPDI